MAFLCKAPLRLPSGVSGSSPVSRCRVRVAVETSNITCSTVNPHTLASQHTGEG